MNDQTFKSAYRTALVIALVYALVTLGPRVSSYAKRIIGRGRSSPHHKKLSARELEVLFGQANRWGPDAQLRCETARDWDYVCSYLPTALPSPRRLHFGVKVDSTRWVDLSRSVPIDTPVPPPTARRR